MRAPAASGVVDPALRLARARDVHLGALVTLLEAEIGTRAIHTGLDAETGMWRAWIGASFLRARPHERGEWLTEPGALRLLLRALRRAHPGRLGTHVIERHGRRA